MTEPLPIVLVPALLASARLYREQVPDLWRIGPVLIADHTRDDSMPALAQRILATAPPRFALVGLSMGGYIAFEMLRRAPERVLRLALLDTSARDDQPQQREQRRQQIEQARAGRLREVIDAIAPHLLHADHRADPRLLGLLRTMAEEVGAEAFVRQQTAIMNRPDSRPGLGQIRCPTLVLVGDGDTRTPVELAREIALGIEGARLAVIAHAGHASTLEAPEAVTRELVSFLS